MTNPNVHLKNFNGWNVEVTEHGVFEGKSPKYETTLSAESLSKLMEKIADYEKKVGSKSIKRLKAYYVRSDEVREVEITSIADTGVEHIVEVWFIYRDDQGKPHKEKTRLEGYSWSGEDLPFALRTEANTAIKKQVDEISEQIDALLTKRRALTDTVGDRLNDEKYLSLVRGEQK